MGLYRFSPVKTLNLSSLVVVAGVAVILFGLAKQAFAWYVHFLFFFLWLYYVSMVFVLGAEAGWFFEHRRMLDRTVSVER